MEEKWRENESKNGGMRSVKWRKSWLGESKEDGERRGEQGRI